MPLYHRNTSRTKIMFLCRPWQLALLYRLQVTILAFFFAFHFTLEVSSAFSHNNFDYCSTSTIASSSTGMSSGIELMPTADLA